MVSEAVKDQHRTRITCVSEWKELRRAGVCINYESKRNLLAEFESCIGRDRDGGRGARAGRRAAGVRNAFRVFRERCNADVALTRRQSGKPEFFFSLFFFREKRLLLRAPDSHIHPAVTRT